MINYFLTFLLIIILFLAYVAMSKDITSPAVLFIAPFVAACLCASVYADKWQLNMCIDTFITIAFGCLEFFVVALIIHNTKKHSNKRRMLNRNEVKPMVISVSIIKIIPIIFIQALSLYVVIKSMRQTLSGYNISGSLRLIIYWFREYHMFSKYNVNISSLASNLRLFSIAVSYYWIYILCNNIIVKKQCRYWLWLVFGIILGFCNSVILGARGEAIQLIVAIFAIYCILKGKYNNWKPNIKFKQMFVIALSALVLMITFKSSGELLGRNAIVDYGVSAIDEVAKYLGAEIKNLDIYLNNRETWKQASFGNYTFGNIISWCSNLLGFEYENISYLPFQKVNGISLGNVYTLFYSYINDFGFLGNYILVGIMAILSQVFYENMSIRKSQKYINIGIIFYSYIAFLISFSFFGERFFSRLINISMIKYLLIWNFMLFYMDKFKLQIKL